MRPNLSVFITLMALVAAISLMAVAGCGGNSEETKAQEASRATLVSGSAPPALPLDTPAPSAGETALGEIETAARKLLADELDVDEGDFRLDSSEGVGWSDASLGCPQGGYVYAQVLTPGYKLVFDLAGTSHAVHTNSDGSHMVICEDGQ